MHLLKRYKKKEMLQITVTLIKANRTLMKAMEHGTEGLQDVFAQCQESAIMLGTAIEEQYTADYPETAKSLVSLLEEYCESIYQMSIMGTNLALCRRLSKNIHRILMKTENRIRYELPKDRREVVFLPYKASMWDSLESVWKAAAKDDNTDAYVIPIPYYDRNPDGSLKQEHYEADQYPQYVPITDYREYSFEERMPDMVFIHNPYDGANFVTTVHPFFYSANIKKYTHCLVYIPYYATAGGMSEAQSFCPAYVNADYIVIQAEKYKKYFDERIPDQKFLPFGSPKFDSVIQKCRNLPEAPDGWLEKIKKRKVYFYNTSINGMLADTAGFLKKMQYVFDTFAGRKDACLLWRPHPLLESTFASMRGEYLENYRELKQRFLNEDIGILDISPGIETAIAYSDVYVGDAGTSVTSLFGVVGKPLFILDNKIHSLPKKDDWKGLVYYVQSDDHRDQYAVVYGNKLYHSPENNGEYHYFCDLSEYAGGEYYSRAYEQNGAVYVLPQNAEHILKISKDKQIHKIQFPHICEQKGAFAGGFVAGKYIFIIPWKYPDLVRLDTETEEIQYVKGIGAFNYGLVNNEYVACARVYHNGNLYFLSVDGTKVAILDQNTLKVQIKETGLKENYKDMIPESLFSTVFWLIPFEGTTVTRWDLEMGEIKDYDLDTEGLKSYYGRRNEICNSRYFGSLMVMEDAVIFAPQWGNKFIRLEPDTGKVSEWKSPFQPDRIKENEYYPCWSFGGFVRDRYEERNYQFYNWQECKAYQVDSQTGEFREIVTQFEYGEVREHVPGFAVESQWMQYCCNENAFHTLEDLLNGTIAGEAFDRTKQLEEFAKINASVDGRCGDRVYEWLREKLEADA